VRSLLQVIAVISLLASLGTCAVAKGAPHEIEAQVWFLIFIVSATGAAALDILRQIAESATEANRLSRERAPTTPETRA
jgi:hypothetical protein